MGLSILLRSESLKVLDRLEDEKDLLHRLLPPMDSASMLGCVDWYGDTIFNHLQMVQFLKEWEQLKKKASETDERILLEKVEGLAHQCKDGIHLYLVFVGD